MHVVTRASHTLVFAVNSTCLTAYTLHSTHCTACTTFTPHMPQHAHNSTAHTHTDHSTWLIAHNSACQCQHFTGCLTPCNTKLVANCLGTCKATFVAQYVLMSKALTATMGLLRMFLARVAYDRVDSVSSTCWADGEQQAIMRAKELPPKLSINSLVSLLSRYGMCT